MFASYRTTSSPTNGILRAALIRLKAVRVEEASSLLAHTLAQKGAEAVEKLADGDYQPGDENAVNHREVLKQAVVMQRQGQERAAPTGGKSVTAKTDPAGGIHIVSCRTFHPPPRAQLLLLGRANDFTTTHKSTTTMTKTTTAPRRP